MIDPKELDVMEAREYHKEKHCTCGTDMPRLIAEVRKLQEVLEQSDD